ncbi:MAG: hypothetical protein H8E62_02030 [Planctomycetes bacterium]|nr:hypothetical protein [Planctomycetota bacterium]
MQVFIKILKFVAGTVLGLFVSYMLIFGLDVVFNFNACNATRADFWLIGGFVSVCVFLCNYLFFIGSSSKKIHTQGIEHLPESIAELIDGIIDVVKYRRSVRADVRQELVDHFTDALAYCENEFEKQKRIGELVAEFGDIKLLGALIRRGKKRCRPLWRTMVARMFQFTGICFLLLILYIGWFFTGKPVITTNYIEIMNEQVRPVADENQNAWPFYKQAAEKRIECEDEKFDFLPRSISTLSEQDRQIIQQAISDNIESLDLIRKGNRKPYYWQVYTHPEEYTVGMIGLLLPHLSDYRHLSRLLCWQGLLRAEQGDFEKAFDDLLEAYSFGQHLRGQNITIIEQLMAMSIEGMSVDIFRVVLAEYDEQIHAAQLNLVRQRFASMIADKDFTIDFGSEKLCMYDEAQRSFTESRFGRSHLYLPRLRNIGGFSESEDDIVALFGKSPIHVLFTHPDKETTLADVERLYAEMEKIAAMTPASVKAQGLDTDEVPLEVIKKNIFLSILMPALERVNIIAWGGRVQAYAVITIMAILQYQKENGEYPQSLNVLVDKGLLKEVPIDPFSDKPLVYRRTDDGFILYSVGSNFTDDGGTSETDSKGKPRSWGKNGDHIFWPVQPVSSQQ